MLTWIDGRYHLDGQGIHAGDGMELRFPDGTWLRVRIESAEAGRQLYAHFAHHEMPLQARINSSDELRWPKPTNARQR